MVSGDAAVHWPAYDPECAAVRARLVRLARHLLSVQGVEPAHIVECRHVVHVGMGEHDRVHLRDSVLDAGLAQFDGRIDEERRLFRADMDACTAAAVSWIG